ncbi:MAG: hypothetical protein U0232_00150, partial [Thermomicrobiales bacterium]
MNVEPQSGPCPHLIAVFLTVTGRALHAGLLLPEPDDPLSPTIVHFQGHLDLREEYAQPNVQWFRPDIPRNATQLARSRALLLAEAARHNQIPFSFGFSGLEIDDHGRTALPCGAGFTCASFILAVFESVGAPLVDLETWSNPAPERRAEDEQAQRRFIDSIAVEDAPHA